MTASLPRTLPSLCGRLRQEAFEAECLHPLAARAALSRGRDQAEQPCELRTAFQRDRDRILHAKAFRRLKHKTQVFIAPEGDHYRTRLTHTLEVAQISRTVARALGLNEDLTEAIGLGHDLGHAPFGHAGERVLDELHQPDGFRHNEQSVRVVEHLEPMNLTWEVRDGILHHTGPGRAATLEGQIVKICDRVAYLNHDLDDAIRAGIMAEQDLPAWVNPTFGASRGTRITTMVQDLVAASDLEGGEIRMSEALHDPFLELRAFMFKRVYTGSRAKREEGKAMGIVERLYRHLVTDVEALTRGLGRAVTPAEAPRAAADFIAGMTDRYAIATFERLFLPAPWRLADESATMGA
ncbi:MAG: deoxyguanosinetriphosphate triphosphohydrolase [Candidatus Sericytochromatia bacterium]|nr:deoxyguanosinetriphosphate triphosphohydrolase [Candidatus Sericytochromatia bacterium]MEB3221442.1 deoxyguanosinetriphosphate triphosphohydrolase [Candidatus Sericytochromatia bacterium]